MPRRQETRDGLLHPRAAPRRQSPPSHRHPRVRGAGPAVPAVPAVSNSLRGSSGRVLPSEPPSPAVVPASPRLVTCSGGRRAPLPAFEGGPGHAGSGQGRRPGPRRRGSPLLCLPPLSAAGVGGRRAGWGGRGRREGRSGAGPPPFSFHSHGQGPRPAPARARVQPGLPPETHPETPTPRTSRAARPPLWLTHSVPASGTPALGRDPSSRTQPQTRQLKTGCAQSGEVAAQGWWRINEPSAEGLL